MHFILIEGRAIEMLADKNKAAASKWRSFGEDEKQPYFEMAQQAPVPLPQHDSWHEAQRILSNFQDSVCNIYTHYISLH